MSNKRDYDLSSIQSGGSGLDAFFAAEPQMVTPTSQAKTAAAKPPRQKVANLAQLSGFQRVSADTLVQKSTQDLWALRKEGEGYFIERLFQDNGKPLKG